ncbi:hypothetical protein O2N63_07200 [Aliiroseovarius sp. KMU-50]|uniref:DUF1905 domain-containing protein n=1 Tax=Aliiroseovarius salicola TaxID=3009082 RepID=A0ABT4W028_9RHOB|nr:hypothetical protein [Aliiroseovarius sp. KMU-50]MDA5093870.1 hypothetical protein [Aliiroseovarius sp. KMU-50]
MTGPPSITFTATILRKQENLPRYVIVKRKHIGARDTSFTAMVQLNDGPPFERRVHPWRKGSDVFFFNVTQVQVRKAGLDTGERCTVKITHMA